MDDVEGISDQTEQTIEGTAHQADEAVVAALQEIRDSVQAMHMDVRALAEKDSSGAIVAQEEQHVEVGQPAVDHQTQQEDHSDPYLRERRPVRKHWLFRRIF